MRVVAEGIETREQMDFLVSRDCDEIQGYIVSAAMPAAEFGAWLDAHDAGEQLEE